MCMLYVSLGSCATPNTCVCKFMGSGVLFICRYSLVLYSAGYGVNSVQVVLLELNIGLLYFLHVYIRMYTCMYALAAFFPGCV